MQKGESSIVYIRGTSVFQGAAITRPLLHSRSNFASISARELTRDDPSIFTSRPSSLFLSRFGRKLARLFFISLCAWIFLLLSFSFSLSLSSLPSNFPVARFASCLLAGGRFIFRAKGEGGGLRNNLIASIGRTVYLPRFKRFACKWTGEIKSFVLFAACDNERVKGRLRPETL